MTEGGAMSPHPCWRSSALERPIREPIEVGSQKPILTYARYIYELIYVSTGLSTKYSDDA